MSEASRSAIPSNWRPRLRFPSPLLAMGLLTAGLSCSQFTPEPAEVDGFALATEMVADIAAGACGWGSKCCELNEIYWDFGEYGLSPDACVDTIVSALQSGVQHSALPSLEPLLLLNAAQDLALGRVVVDEAGVAACAVFLEQRACNSYEHEVDLGSNCLPGGMSVDDPCSAQSLFIGLVEAGGECRVGFDHQCVQGRCAGNLGTGTCSSTHAVDEACSFDWECSPGLYCEPKDRECQVGAELGQLCSYVNPEQPIAGTELTRCAEGLFCDPLQARCVAPCTNGALCNADSECPIGLVCAIDRCRVLGDTGAPCDSPTDCESTRCDFIIGICLESFPDGRDCVSHDECASGYCEALSKQCQAPLPPGEPCLSFDDRQCEASYCDFADPLEPVCRAYVAAGEPCDPIVDRCDPEHEENLSCSDDKCRSVPFENGVTCASDSWCASDICHMGLCVAGSGPGASCDSLQSTVPCALGLFCNQVSGDLLYTCAQIHDVGEPCTQPSECWGQCELRWGQLMCDDTLAPLEEVVWCDQT